MKFSSKFICLWTILFTIFMPIVAFAATTASETASILPTTSDLWKNFILFAGTSFVTFLTGLMGFVTKILYEIGRKYIASTKYSQELTVLWDALYKSLVNFANKKGTSYITMLKDFTLTKEEKEIILSDAKELAKEGLSQIRGLTKDVGGAWVGDKLSALLGELEFRVLGLSAVGTSNSNSK